MGIFTDLAIGGITQFDETARRDTEKNTTMANIALEKENDVKIKLSKRRSLIESGLVLSEEKFHELVE